MIGVHFALLVLLLVLHASAAQSAPTFELLRCTDGNDVPFVRLDARGDQGTMYKCDFAWKEYAHNDYGGASITLSGYDIAHMQLSYDRKTFAQLAAPDNVLRLVHTRTALSDDESGGKDAPQRTQWFTVKFRYFECVDDGAPLTLLVRSLRRPGDRASVEFDQSRQLCTDALDDQTSDATHLIDGTAAAFAIWILLLLLCLCIGCIYIEPALR